MTDGAAWAVALVTAMWFRHVLEATRTDVSHLLQFLSVVLAAQWSIGWAAHLYRGRYRVGSLDEAVRLAWVVIGAGLIALVVGWNLPVPLVPRSVPLTSAFFALFLAVAARRATRRRQERFAVTVRPRGGLVDLKEIDITELLGRPRIDTHIATIAGYLTHKRILVTGAGGSIGSELCRQIHQFGPAALYMLDHDESALHAVRLSIHGTALLDSSDVVLSDICDYEAVRTVFEECRPDVVFHTAALKHLPMLEQYPLEAWKTNVLGTHHVLEAARSVGVRTFVNVSTDKAANPTSVLGYSKRIGERLTAETASRSEGCYLSVRFGNVLGSRGSVLTTFAEQLAQGNPITITHPDTSRYFMTIHEAVQLVIQAAAIGRSGEALVFDMGEPVRIGDIARQLMEMSGKSVPIVYTGLRVGEKLHEECFGLGENDRRPLHPAISHISVPPLDMAQLRSLALVRGEVVAMSECGTDVPRPRAPQATPATRGVQS